MLHLSKNYQLLTMKSLVLLGTCLICLFVLQAKAQPIAGNGCMTTTSPNRVYQQYVTTKSGKPVYKGYATQYSEWTVQYDITSYPCFTWTQTAANGCYIRMTSSSSSDQLGNYGNFTGSAGTNCPIDDYVIPLAILVGSISYWQIRKRHPLPS